MAHSDGVTTLDLAARQLGGSVLAASDESFGAKESLIETAAPDFRPGRYGPAGEIVDGWETRRRRKAPGDCDWVIVRLAATGIIEAIDVDTAFFTGNAPSRVRLEALCADGYPSVDELRAPQAPWYELADLEPVPDAHNLIAVDDPRGFTHVRLSAYPDGGIARLRVHGRVLPDPRLWAGVTVELSSARVGATVRSSTDDHYGSASNLVLPDAPRTMGDGWEAARRRGGDDETCDSVQIVLAARGRLRRAEIDTTHFKHNASSSVALWATPDADATTWQPLLARTRLQPDTRHVFVLESGPVAAVRVDAFPDGGLARVRLFGDPADPDGDATVFRAARPERVLGEWEERP